MDSAGSTAFFSCVQLSPAMVRRSPRRRPFGKTFSPRQPIRLLGFRFIACYFSCGYSRALFIGGQIAPPAPFSLWLPIPASIFKWCYSLRATIPGLTFWQLIIRGIWSPLAPLCLAVMLHGSHKKTVGRQTGKIYDQTKFTRDTAATYGTDEGWQKEDAAALVAGKLRASRNLPELRTTIISSTAKPAQPTPGA